MKKFVLLVALLGVLSADDIDDALEGFDDIPQEQEALEDDLEGFGDEEINTQELLASQPQQEKSFLDDFNGYVAFLSNYSYRSNSTLHDKINIAKTSVFLDYENRFYKNWKFKINAKAYYDAIYNTQDGYTQQEKDAFESELRLYDAYVEGSITQSLDAKLGRQVVVWGRSDTIRITDVLNPLDNRRFAMVDIEDLRLPTTMAKFDYYAGKWKISPIVILEQQFSLRPPFGSPFYPAPVDIEDKSYSDVTCALSIGAEFKSWDVNFYGAYIRDDAGYVALPLTPTSQLEHPKVVMGGMALNYIYSSWLIKSELAHFEKLRYTTVPNKEFSRSDALVGFEYNGIAETMISYDVALRYIDDYDTRLTQELIPKKQKTYEHALRVTSDFVNDTLHFNFLTFLQGENLSDGGFVRIWGDYDYDDNLRLRVGVVDYIGGYGYFEQIKNEDMIFGELRYSF